MIYSRQTFRILLNFEGQEEKEIFWQVTKDQNCQLVKGESQSITYNKTR